MTSDPREQLEALLQVAEACGLIIRRENLGGEGGGFCRIKGQGVIFVDLASDPFTQLTKCAQTLARTPQVEAHFLRPDLRALIEAHRQPTPEE